MPSAGTPSSTPGSAEDSSASADRRRVALRSLLARIWTVACWVLPPLVIMVLGWAPLTFQVSSSVDYGWVSALYMAVHDGLSFGTRVVFTYGPLGFLTQPEVWHVHLAILAFIYTVAIRFGVAAAIYHRARATFSSVIAFAIAVVVVSVGLGMAQNGEVVLMMIVAAWALDRGITGDLSIGFAALAGAYVGFQSLSRISVGVVLGLVLAILVVGLPERRRVCAVVAVGGLLASIVAFWLISGQDLGTLPSYLARTSQVAAGYTSAMSAEDPSLGWEYAAAFIGLALGIWAAFVTSDGAQARQRWVLMLLWGCSGSPPSRRALFATTVGMACSSLSRY